MSRQQEPTIIQYLIGGLFGNAPMLFTLTGLTFLDPQFLQANLIAVNIALLASMFGGAALSAFYVAVNVQSRHIYRVLVVGLVTGAFCYLLNLVLSLFFSYFFYFQLPLGDYLKLATFIPGGAVGAYIRSKRKRIVRRPPPSGTKTP